MDRSRLLLRHRSVSGALAALVVLVGFLACSSNMSAAPEVPAEAAPGQPAEPNPTIVLVHGAFADASSWNGVIAELMQDGYDVRALANPLRSVKADADYISSSLAMIDGPIVLVGHSYGGMVINDAAIGNPNVKALVFVAAFAPEPGESGASLSGKFPGSTLGPTLQSVPLKGGGTDLYIAPDHFPDQFAADVPLSEARLMAATQRPINQAALNEAAAGAGWKSVPSWFIFGDLDKNIPVEAQRFMASRANARRTVEIKGASHAIGVSHPGAVADLIKEAATAK